MSTALAERKATIRSLLSRADVKKQLELALPSHVGMDRFLRVTTTTIMRNEKLMQCTPHSLLACLITCGQLGIEPDPVTGLAYMIPFKNKGVYEAQLIVGYKGLLKLIRNSGELQSVSCQVVYENDDFLLQFGLEERLEHTPTDGDRGKPKGAYVIFRYKDGGYSFEYMSVNDINQIRKRSKSADSGPWVTDWAQMACKTVIRRHAKLAPISIELQRAAALDDRHNSGQTQMDIHFQEGATDEEPEPIDVEAEEEGAEVVQLDEKAVEKFNRLMAEKKLSGDATLEEFLNLCAERNNAPSIDAVKASGAANFDRFMEAFDGFRAKKEDAATKKEAEAKKKDASKKGEAVKKKADAEAARKRNAETAEGEPVVECPLNPGQFVELSHCEANCVTNADCETFKAAKK